jgi:hypothetical protein
VALLVASGECALLPLGARPEEVAHRHAEAVREQVRDAQDHHNRAAQARARGAGHDRERSHSTIDRPVDEVAKVARGWRLGQASLDCLRAVVRRQQIVRSSASTTAENHHAAIGTATAK